MRRGRLALGECLSSQGESRGEIIAPAMQKVQPEEFAGFPVATPGAHPANSKQSPNTIREGESRWRLGRVPLYVGLPARDIVSKVAAGGRSERLDGRVLQGGILVVQRDGERFDDLRAGELA